MPELLVTVSSAHSHSALSVYRWHQNQWRRAWSKVWETGTQKKLFSSEAFRWVGATSLMGGRAEELVTTYWSTGGDAGVSSLTVWKWRGARLRPALTLQEPDGAISGSIRGRTLRVVGVFLKGNECMACAATVHMTVRYVDGRWQGSARPYMTELVTGRIPAPPPKATLTVGTGFDDNTFALTGVATSFPAYTAVDWLLDDPSPFGATTAHLQLYEKAGADAWSLVQTTPITLSPNDDEVEDGLTALAPGTYQLEFIIGNKVIQTTAFTVRS